MGLEPPTKPQEGKQAHVKYMAILSEEPSPHPKLLGVQKRLSELEIELDIISGVDIKEFLKKMSSDKSCPIKAFFVLHKERLGLLPNQWPRVNPIQIDFESPDFLSLKKSISHDQILSKAIGIKNKPQILWDLTSGLLKDSYYFLLLGLQVVAVERNPFVFCLQEEALSQQKKWISQHQESSHLQKKSQEEILSHLQIFYDSAENFLQNSGREDPDIIYLDPLFPKIFKKSKSNKQMELFHLITPEGFFEPEGGAQEFQSSLIDSQKNLLNQSLQRAKLRVVVKRPKEAPPLLQTKNLFSYEGKSVRYDMYRKL